MVHFNPDHQRDLKLERRADGQLWASIDGLERAVRVHRCFPWSEPGRFLSLRDTDNEEFALVAALDELNGISLRVVLSRTYNMPTLTFDQRLRCASLPPEATRAMGITPGTAGMIWEIFGRTYRRQPASYQRVFLPAGHRPIEITSSM